MPKSKATPKTSLTKFIAQLNLNQWVESLNASRFFAGIMIIILNIASKFITIHFSKSMESFLKYTFSRNILVFAICYVGSRDIFVSLCITIVFILFMDFLFNEECSLCILPKSFTEYYTKLMENMENKEAQPTPTEIKKAIQTLSKMSAT